MTKLIIKPQDRHSIDFAETERLKSLSSSGSIVHEEDISNVEHIETIYDASSDDSSLNWGYTSGLSQFSKTIDLSKYKYLKFYYGTTGYTGGYTIGFVDLMTLRENNYFGDSAGILFKANGSVPFLTIGKITVNSTKKILTTNTINRWYNSDSDLDGSGRIVKIEGAY